MNGLEAPDELQINTVSHNTVNTNTDRPKPTCHLCKKPGHYRNKCRLLKRQKEQSEDTENIPANKKIGANNPIPNKNTKINNKNNNYKTSDRAERKPKTVYLPCDTCGKTNQSTEKCYYGANAAKTPPPGHRRPEKQNQVPERAKQNDQMKLCRQQPKIKTEIARSSQRSSD